MKVVKIFLVSILLTTFLSCSRDFNSPVEDLIPLNFNVVNNTAIMTGEIFTDTPEQIQQLLNEHPKLNTIILLNVPGSADDDANLEAARLIRAHGITTIVPSNGLVASGGTDFFLAGKNRIIETGAKIGVHSWATNDSGPEIQGHELPRSSEEHQLYLDYFEEMNINENFYWFTLQAADADDMYWMTATEIAKYQLATK